MYFTIICYATGIFVAAAVAYRLLNLLRRRRQRIMKNRVFVPSPPLGGVRYDFICCLRADGTGGKTIVRRITDE